MTALTMTMVVLLAVLLLVLIYQRGKIVKVAAVMAAVVGLYVGQSEAGRLITGSIDSVVGFFV
jgi:hypothetical protein